jgi:hypothetical protein
MSEELTAVMDTRGLFSAFEKVGPTCERRLRAASFVTAQAIRDEARRRVARKSGATAQGIVIREYDNSPYFLVATSDTLSQEERLARVEAQKQDPKQYRRRWTAARYRNVPHVGVYLEYGTVRAGEHPFFWESARVEQAAYDRRVKEALVAALEESGLGR